MALDKAIESGKEHRKPYHWALEPDEKKPEKIRIISQEHAAELVDMAKEWFI